MHSRRAARRHIRGGSTAPIGMSPAALCVTREHRTTPTTREYKNNGFFDGDATFFPRRLLDHGSR